MSVKSTPSRNSSIVTKAMMDAIATGMNYLSAKPAIPVIGDHYVDDDTGNGYVYDGKNWMLISGDPSRQPRLIPTPEELEKHPSLKAAWEEYMVLRRLIGI